MNYEQVIQKWHDFPGDILPCFISGTLVFVRNKPEPLYENRDLIYQTKFIMSDGKPYNLHDADSVRSIPIPQNKTLQLSEEYVNMGVTGRLEYILSRKATKIRNSNHELANALLSKAVELMPQSPIMYARKDYMRLANWFAEDGMFDKAHEVKALVDKLFYVPYRGYGPRFMNENSASMLNKAIEEATKYGRDLVRSSENGACCANCAIYRGRIFSISGKNTSFPALPTYECDCNGITFIPIVLTPTDEQIAKTNRPYIDDRSESEKRNYQDVLDSRIYHRITENDHFSYYRLKKHLPHETPKSFTAFCKMRNENTETFQALSKMAEGFGIRISISEEERKAIERHKAFCKTNHLKL